MATIVLARHGETDWNRDGRWQGHADPPLNDDGRRQAEELAGEVESVDAVYSSDLARARETAEIVAGRLGLPVETDPRLREVDLGEWSGLRTVEIEEQFPEGHRRWVAYESHGWSEGESYGEMGDRVLEALREIAAKHPDGRVLVITHGGPIRAVEAELRGIEPLEARRLIGVVGNCSLAEIAIREGAITRVD